MYDSIDPLCRWTYENIRNLSFIGLFAMKVSFRFQVRHRIDFFPLFCNLPLLYSRIDSASLTTL
jgi:hypothetical protein